MMQSPDRRSAVIIFLVIVLLSFLAALHGCSVAENPEITSVTIEPLHTTAANNSVTIASQTMQLFTATSHYSNARTVNITSSAERTRLLLPQLPRLGPVRSPSRMRG
jgi:hypothetical protein